MKIAVNAFGLPPNLAGSGFYTRQLYDRLARLPEVSRVVIFTNRDAAPHLRSADPKIEVRGYPARGQLGKVAFSQLVFPFLARGFDVIHSVGNVGSVLAPGPQLVSVLDLCHKTLPDRFGFSKRAYLSAFFHLTVNFTRARFTCISASTENDFLRYYPRSRGRTSVAHLASKFSVSSATRDADARFGRGGYLLFVGTIEPGKNLSLALAALALLTEPGASPVLKIAGARGWKQSELPALAERLGVADRVQFLGSVSEAELQVLYRDAAMMVFPSRYEGFGLPILEAQSQGCVVAAAENSCMREVGGEGAVYFRDNDAADMARAVREILLAPGRAEALRAAGFANVGRFAWEKTAERTLRALKECVAARSAKG